MVAAAPTLADAARMGLLKDGMQPNDPDVQGPLDRETREESERSRGRCQPISNIDSKNSRTAADSTCDSTALNNTNTGMGCNSSHKRGQNSKNGTGANELVEPSQVPHEPLILIWVLRWIWPVLAMPSQQSRCKQQGRVKIDDFAWSCTPDPVSRWGLQALRLSEPSSRRLS